MAHRKDEPMVPLNFWQGDVIQTKNLEKLIDMQRQRAFGPKPCHIVLVTVFIFYLFIYLFSKFDMHTVSSNSS